MLFIRVISLGEKIKTALTQYVRVPLFTNEPRM